jgi:hypothetical protein
MILELSISLIDLFDTSAKLPIGVGIKTNFDI